MKKQGGRIFSVLLALSILVCNSVCLIGEPVAAANDVVFDLDVENLADRSGNNVQITQVGTITKGSFTNETGETVPYMTTGNGNDIKNSSKAGTLKIADSSIVGLTDYTIEAWIRYKEPTDNSLYPKIFKHTDYTNTLFAYEMPNDSGADAIMVGSKKPIQKVTNSAELSGTWAHYVFTFDTIYEGDTAISIRPNIYVNGVSLTKDYQTVPEVTDSAALAMLGKAKEFSIGGQTNNGAFHTAFSGDFAEFRIYSSIKSDSEIASMYSSSADKYIEKTEEPEVQDGTVMLDLDPAALADRSGNNVQITQVGTITKGSFTNETGETVPYMTTGNGNDIKNSSKAGTLKIADSSIVGLTDYTIEAWIRYKEPTDNSLYPKIFKHTDYTNTLFAYEMPNDSGADAIMVGSKKPIQKVTNSAELSGTWAHYVFTFDTIYEGDTAISIRPNIYVNGVSLTKDYQTVPEVTDSAALAMLGKAKEFSIGGQTNNGAFHTAFSGDFAEFKIYKGVKTDDEIKALYDSSAPGFTEWNDSVRRPSIGMLNVGLGKNIKAESLIDKVKLEKVETDVSNGETITPAKGGVYTSVSESDASMAILRFGMLEDNAKYRITIDADVTFDDNTTLGSNKILEFSTGKSVLIDTDFTDYENSDLTKDGLSYRCNDVTGDTSNITVENVTLKNDIKDTVLRFKATDANKSNRIYFGLDNHIGDGEVLKIEEKARSYNAKENAYRAVNETDTRMMRFVGDSDEKTNIPVPDNVGIVRFDWGGFLDDDSFIDFVSYVNYSKTTNTFCASRLLADGSFSDESVDLKINKINSLMPVELYLTSSDVENSYVELSKYKVTRGIAPNILNVKYDEASKTITVVFNDDMTDVNVNTLELFQRLSSENDVKVNGTLVSYDASERTACIRLAEPLAIGSYLINVTDAVSPTAGKWNGYSEFSVTESSDFTRNITFKAGDVDIVEGSSIPAGTNKLTATIKFKNGTGEPRAVTCFAVLYDAERNLIKVSAMEKSTIDVGNTDKTISIDDITTKEGYIMRVFIWDSIENLSPVFMDKSVGGLIK